MDDERLTFGQRAYRTIRQLIIDGELQPGAKVVVRPLCEQLGLSPTPIKAALAGLERDGFLLAIPHRGYHVPMVTPEDMQEIYELREVLDGIAARRAASLPDARRFVEATLRPIHERQSAVAATADLIGYSDLDREFHRAISHVSANSRLVHVTDNLDGQLRFGSGSSSRLPGRVRTAMREHAAIMQAVAAGDSERAERAARDHVRRSAAAFRRSVQRG